MVKPEQVAKYAKRKEKENLRFRTFLKTHADETNLDQQFLKLHKELFEGYECGKCRNCCKMYHGSIPKEDLEKDAAGLDMTTKQFIDRFLERNDIGSDYETKHMPCEIWERLKLEYRFR